MKPRGGALEIDDDHVILVGEPIGRQSDIGSASGTHLHFEVAAIPPGTSPPFSELGGFISNSAWNRVTVVCFSDGDLEPAVRSVAAPLRVGDLGLPLAINCTHSRWSARGGRFEERVGPKLLQSVARIERSYGVMFPSEERRFDDS